MIRAARRTDAEEQGLPEIAQCMNAVCVDVLTAYPDPLPELLET